jgi:MFS family permease
MTGVEPEQPDRRVTYGEVFAVREYRALWSAQVLSVAGDQLARVALSVLVFDRTGSALLTGATYAMTFLPWAVGGPLTAGLADRLPRRTLMIVCDVVRALMVAAVALPGLPLWLMLVLLFVGGLFAPPFSSARASLIPQVFPDEDRYVVASAISNTTTQAAQVLGFATGGAVVALLGARPSLLLDAATFLASAVVVAVGVRRRAAATTKRTSRGRWTEDLRAGLVLVFGDRRLRALVLLAWLCSFYVAPEALAVPYAHSQGAGPVAVGLLLAANPVGSTTGALVVGRFVSASTRRRWMLPMAALTGVPLMVCVVQPGLPLTWLLWAASGIFSAYNLAANAEFALAVPNANRGQAFGLVISGMMVGQGAGLFLAGLLAEYPSPLSVVALAGLSTVLVAASLVRSSSTRSDVPRG